MPPPDAVDTAAALRLDVVQVRWRFAPARPSWAAADRTPIKSAPAEQEVVLQHGRLSGQQRVLLDGALVSSTQPAKRFADGGHTHAFAAAGGAACELRVVPRSTSVGGFEYTLRVDGTTVAAIPASSAVSLRTPRTAREAAAALASQKKSARGRLAAELTRSPNAMKSSTPKERQDAARWAAEAAGENGSGGYANGDAPTGRTLDRIRNGSGGGSNTLWDAAAAAAEQTAAARKTADAKTKEREQWEKRARDLWGSVHDKAPQVVLVLRPVEDPKTGEVNEALQVARLLLFASIDRAGLHHVTYPGRDGVEYLGLSADEMRLIKEADRLGVEMRLGRASQHPAIEMTRGGKMRWPRRGRIVDGAFVEDNENGELVTGKQFRDAVHKKPSVYFFGAEFEDFALDKLERFSAYQPIGIEKRLFTPLERQRLILSILQARPIDDGAAVDTLMATKDERSMAWRMALPKEKQTEQEAFDDEILEKTGIDMETEAGLLRYEARGGSVLTHVFAVHDVRTRYRIHQKWHRGCPRLYGPARTLLYLDDLRDYFGEKVAFYFAFMDHYTRWLAYASAPALVVLIVQVVPFQNLCDQDCTAEARLVTGVDNIMVIPSCVGIAIWAAFFLATWKRKSSTLAFRWDVQDFSEEEPIRAAFRQKATEEGRWKKGYYKVGAGFMPLGERDAPYFPRAERVRRFGTALMVTACFMAAVIIGTFAILAFRVHLRVSQQFAIDLKALVDTFVPVSDDDAGSGGNGTAEDGDGSLTETLVGYVSPSLAAMCVASGLNLVFIVIFNMIYRYVARVLTDWENHRTESEYEKSYIIKSFSFQAVNSYISFFYIAFVRSQHLQLFGMEYEASSGEILPLRDSCSTSSWSGERRENDCMGDLFIQMVIVVLGKEVFRNVYDVVVPGIMYRIKARTCTPARAVADDKVGVDQLDLEVRLSQPLGVAREYNAMAIQFGYIVMFASVAPWATFVCLLINLVERRADAARMLYAQQRPRYKGAQSIGTWLGVFQALTICAIFSNCFILGYTSKILSTAFALTTEEILAVVVILEHALLLAKLLIALGIAEVPLWVVKTREYKRWVMERLDEATALGRGASFDAELAAARGRLDAEFENEVGIMEEGLRLQGRLVDDVDNVIDEHLGEPAGRSPASRGGRGEELQFL